MDTALQSSMELLHVHVRHHLPGGSDFGSGFNFVHTQCPYSAYQKRLHRYITLRWLDGGSVQT